MLAFEAEILRLIKKFYGEWASSMSSSTLSTQEYTTAGTHTWTVPTGVTYAYVSIVGGGGGGGGSVGAYSMDGTACGGGGGGGQAVWRQLVTGLTPAGTVTVTIGAAGTGGASCPTTDAEHLSGVNGVSGGNSSFGSYVIVLGGQGGRAAFHHSGIVAGSGGAGGGGSEGGCGRVTSGDYNAHFTAGSPSIYSEYWISGAGGGAGMEYVISGTYFHYPYGYGGSSARYSGGSCPGYGGGGGASIFGVGGNGGSWETDGSSPSSGYGGGGGGGGYTTVSYPANGAAGTCGYCLIEYPTI